MVFNEHIKQLWLKNLKNIILNCLLEVVRGQKQKSHFAHSFFGYLGTPFSVPGMSSMGLNTLCTPPAHTED